LKRAQLGKAGIEILSIALQNKSAHSEYRDYAITKVPSSVSFLRVDLQYLTCTGQRSSLVQHILVLSNLPKIYALTFLEFEQYVWEEGSRLSELFSSYVNPFFLSPKPRKITFLH